MNEEQDVDIEELYGFVSENRVKVHEGQMRKHLAEILLNLDSDHLDTAENWILEAIEADKRNGMKFYLGRDYVLSAEIYQRKGDQAKAKKDMNQAIDIFKECGADGWVQKYEKELRGY
jgi:tetratricopeptide (TPR) repeat protein